MKLVLLVLGSVLILQTAIHVASGLVSGPVSFTTIGKTIDEDLVRLTAGLCAVHLARVKKSNS